LPWSAAAEGLRARVALLRREFPNGDWPDLSDAALMATLPEWLGPFIGGARRRDHLSRIDTLSALRALLPWPLPARLDELAPTHVLVPSGSDVAVDYAAEGGPA